MLDFGILALTWIMAGAILLLFSSAMLWTFKKVTKKTTTFATEAIVLFVITLLEPFVAQSGIDGTFGWNLDRFIYNNLPALAVALVMLWWINKGDDEDE